MVDQASEVSGEAAEAKVTARGARITGVFLVGQLVLWFGVAGSAFHASLPFNPIRLSPAREAAFREVLPEGWKFFTRNPQDEQSLPFARIDGAWTSVSLGPNARASNSFGIGRAGRAQSIELAALLEHLPSKAWMDCEEDAAACLSRAPVAGQVTNRVPAPTLCGDVGVVSGKPIPWAWASSGDHMTMPSRVVRLEVRC